MVPAWESAFQKKVWPLTSLLCTSRALASNCWVWPLVRVAVAGVTATKATAPGFTVTVALPMMVPTAATTVSLNSPAVVPAVNRPFWSMAPPPAATLHLKVSPPISLSYWSSPFAPNCWLACSSRVTLGGVTRTLASSAGRISTPAVPDTEPEAALIAPAYIPGLVPAVSLPVWSMVPAAAVTTLQVKVKPLTSLSYLSYPLAEY